MAVTDILWESGESLLWEELVTDGIEWEEGVPEGPPTPTPCSDYVPVVPVEWEDETDMLWETGEIIEWESPGYTICNIFGPIDCYRGMNKVSCYTRRDW